MQSSYELEKQRKAEERNDNLIIMREQLDKRAAIIAKDRAMHRERREREAREKKEARERELQKESENALKVTSEEELKKNEIRIESRRKSIIETSPDIYELRCAVKSAYIKKELETQVKEKLEEESKKIENYKCERNEIEKIIKTEENLDRDVRMKEINKKLEYRKVLQDQIINKYKEKQENYKQILKERALLDDSLRVILEEDQMELLREVERKKCCVQEIEQFKQAKALWTLREKELLEEEDRQIKKYWKQKEEEEKQLKMKEDIKTVEKNRMRGVVNVIMATVLANKVDNEDSLRLKIEMEEEEKMRRKEEQEFKKSNEVKKNLKDELARQIEDKRVRMRSQMQEDIDYVQQKMKEFEEDKEIAKLKAEKKRLAQCEYRNIMLREIEEKRFREKLAEEESLELRKIEEQNRKERRTILEEERIRILQTHCGNLVGFLPPGFLQPKDLPHLPANVREFYESKDKSARTPDNNEPTVPSST